MIAAPFYFQNHILQINIIHKIEIVTGQIQSKLKVENEKMKVQYKSKKKGLCNQCDRGEIMKNSISYTLVAEMHVNMRITPLQIFRSHKQLLLIKKEMKY